MERKNVAFIKTWSDPTKNLCNNSSLVLWKDNVSYTNFTMDMIVFSDTSCNCWYESSQSTHAKSASILRTFWGVNVDINWFGFQETVDFSVYFQKWWDLRWHTLIFHCIDTHSSGLFWSLNLDLKSWRCVEIDWRTFDMSQYSSHGDCGTRDEMLAMTELLCDVKEEEAGERLPNTILCCLVGFLHEKWQRTRQFWYASKKQPTTTEQAIARAAVTFPSAEVNDSGKEKSLNSDMNLEWKTLRSTFNFPNDPASFGLCWRDEECREREHPVEALFIVHWLLHFGHCWRLW